MAEAFKQAADAFLNRMVNVTIGLVARSLELT